MKQTRVGRREFVRGLAGSAAAVAAMQRPAAATPLGQTPPKLRFGVIGINHGHINGQVEAVLRGGGELVAVYAKEPDLLAAFTKRFPQAKVARASTRSSRTSRRAARAERRDPGRARAARHPRDAARQGLHGRQAGHHLARRSWPRCARCRPQTKRIYSIMYSERFENRATVKAGELVKAGAIGKVVQTIGLGPHRINTEDAPGVVLRRRALRRHPVRHRLAPGRPVPVLHRLDARRGRRVAGRQRAPPAVPRASRTSAT